MKRSDVGYNVIGEGIVLVDHGPVTMTLEAKRKGLPLTEAAIAGAERVLEVFDGLTENIELIRKFISDININEIRQGLPDAVLRMIGSVGMLEEPDFTPLAAVAGTVSDLAVEEICANGSDYAMVNNGGDIAWSISESGRKSVKAALISDIRLGNKTHGLDVRSFSEIRGIATSGMGGRSLTRGIASAVTALAASSSLADAAATSIANSCYSDDPAVFRCLAEDIDPDTDIRGLLVTKRVGELKKESVCEALFYGKRRAEDLLKRGMIRGAVIFVSGEMTVVGDGGPGSGPFEVHKLDSK